MLSFGVHETCPYPFTHGKYAWTSNMDLIKIQFISLWKGCHQLPKRGRLKSLVWFWWIDETLSASLVYQSDYEIGCTFQVVKQMKIMTWWWRWHGDDQMLGLGKEERKTKISRQMWNCKELFGLVIETLRECDHI